MPAAPQNLPNRCSRLNTATTGVNFRLRLLKQWKIRIAYKQLGSKFPRRRTKPNTKRKTEIYIFSGFGNFISRGWERKSSTTRFATGRFWPFTWKTSSVRKDKVNKWEFILIGNYAHCFIWNHDSTIISIMSLSANVRYDCRFFYFHSLMRSTFLVTKGYCVNMINKIIHGCL